MKVLLLVLAFSFSFAHAQPFVGPLTSSLAGTGRAGIDGAEGGLVNPALIPLLKNYELDSYFRDGSLDNGKSRHAWALGAGDNGPDVLFPGSLHYVKLRDTGRVQNPADGEFIHAAIARMVVPTVSVGISGYRLSYKVVEDREYVQWNYSLGGLWMFSPQMGIGYVINNLAKPSDIVPVGLREDLQQGFGFFTTLGELARMRADVTRNETRNPGQKLAYMVSFESMSGKFALLRIGYRRDEQQDQKVLTAGLGFNGPRLKVDYSFEKQLEGTSGALHSVDLRIPF
jgi:hypothetical protein